MKLLQYAVAVVLFIMVCAEVFVIHAKPHGAVEQYSDFLRRRGHGFGIANTCSQPSVERAECGMGASNRDGPQRNAAVTLLLVLRVYAKSTLPPLKL